MKIKNILVLFFIITNLFPVFLIAQDNDEVQYTLGLLRGTWEFHTFDSKRTLQFNSDEQMSIDAKQYNYSIQSDTLTINDKSQSLQFRILLSNDSCALISDDGFRQVFSRIKYGEEESFLNDIFYSYLDSVTRHTILFSNGNEFEIRAISPDEKNIRGIYRIDGDNIYLASDNEYFDVARIYHRDYSNRINVIIYQNHYYDLEESEEPPDSGPTPKIPPIWDPPPPPPPPPHPHPHPPFPPRGPHPFPPKLPGVNDNTGNTDINKTEPGRRKDGAQQSEDKDKSGDVQRDKKRRP